MDLKQFRKYLDSLPKNIEKALVDANNAITEQYTNILTFRSPIDTGKLKSSWNNTKYYRGYDFETMIENTAEGNNGFRYAHSIEFGSTPGERPYPRVGKRTVMYNGRIYSSQAPGGITQHITEDVVQVSAEYLGNQLIEAFI